MKNIHNRMESKYIIFSIIIYEEYFVNFILTTLHPILYIFPVEK